MRLFIPYCCFHSTESRSNRQWISTQEFPIPRAGKTVRTSSHRLAPTHTDTKAPRSTILTIGAKDPLLVVPIGLRRGRHCVPFRRDLRATEFQAVSGAGDVRPLSNRPFRCTPVGTMCQHGLRGSYGCDLGNEGDSFDKFHFKLFVHKDLMGLTGGY